MLLPALSLLGAEPGYVDPGTCRACHQGIYDSYAKTGMGRSFARAEFVPSLPEFVHEKSGRRYSVVERSGTWFLRRDAPGLIEKRIDYAMGSGNHSKTFLHRDSRGKLIELPVSWYSERGGSWAMSPGYDRPDHSDFRREASDSCLFCHNGYPSEANGGLASGIDCQRCHGPGEAHVRRKGSIVNPGKLARERQMDVCLQCHLESSSRTLPDAVRVFDRGPFSYRAGEPLSDFKLYFQFAGASNDEDRITVNNSGFQLLQSACYRKSARMTCTTCHDPHAAYRGAEAERRFTATCRSCHASTHEATTTNCAECHMPKRRTEDAVHVVMTDHRIRRRPPAGDLLAPVSERHDRLSGRIKPLYPEHPPSLYAAIAQAQASADLKNDVVKLEQAMRAARTSHAQAYRVLGEAYRKLGRTSDAIGAYQTARAKDASDPMTYVALGELLAGQGRLKEATELLESGPDDVSVLNARSVLYARQNRFREATDAVSKALQINADDPVSWLNFGVCLQASGDKKGAEAAYRQALLLQPDLARARDYLNAVLKDKL
jgi:predicted CXXCH cytochrome family protein